MRAYTWVLLGCATVGGVLMSAPRADAARPKLSVRKKALSPLAVNGTGSRVWVAVDVKRTVNPARAVGVRLQIPGGSGAHSWLDPAGANRYQGYCNTPANTTRGVAKVNVVVIVTSADGVDERRIGTIKIAPGDESLPPPPPSN